MFYLELLLKTLKSSNTWLILGSVLIGLLVIDHYRLTAELEKAKSSQEILAAVTIEKQKAINSLMAQAQVQSTNLKAKATTYYSAEPKDKTNDCASALNLLNGEPK